MQKGWLIKHGERFVYRANSGNPDIELRVYFYPEYRQKVISRKMPDGFKLRRKGLNMALVFRGKLASRGSISLDREALVLPQTERKDMDSGLGRISEIDRKISEKYREASRYWPLKSEELRPDGGWFEEDDMSSWLRSVWKYLRSRISPENQEKRWGAEEAMKRGIGDCDEFTDSFITLARMRGIPSRRITGLFIRDGDYERHAWAEAYSPEKGWITVDIALNNIGNHTKNYVILKVEEFNPAMPDYHVNIRHSSRVHYSWELEDPVIEAF